MIAPSKSYAAVVEGVIVEKGSRAIALRRVKAARRAGECGFVGLAPNREIGERWPQPNEEVL